MLELMGRTQVSEGFKELDEDEDQSEGDEEEDEHHSQTTVILSSHQKYNVSVRGNEEKDELL